MAKPDGSVGLVSADIKGCIDGIIIGRGKQALYEKSPPQGCFLYPKSHTA